MPIKKIIGPLALSLVMTTIYVALVVVMIVIMQVDLTQTRALALLLGATVLYGLLMLIPTVQIIKIARRHAQEQERPITDKDPWE